MGLETYWEHYTGLPDSYRTNTMNAIAGISDAATFGATYKIRDWIGVNEEIDSACSSFYEGGEWASLAVGGGAAIKFGGKSAYRALFNRGNGLLNSNNFLRVGEGWVGSAMEGSKVYRAAFGHRSWPKIQKLPKFPWHINFWKW